MARTPAQIEAIVREQMPTIEVCDNGVCTTWTTGDATYEAWVAQTVADHLAGDAALDEDDARKQLAQAVQIALEQLEGDAETLETTAVTLAQMRQGLARTNRTVARLIRYLVRTGVIAP